MAVKIEIKWNPKIVLKDTKREATEALNQGGAHLQNKIKASMKPGRHLPYRSRKNSKKIHWSSKPGRPPAPDTERLKESITYQVSGVAGRGSDPGSSFGGSNNDGVKKPADRPSRTASVIGTNVRYGFILETTTRSNTRPWLRPMFEREFKNMMKFFNRVTKK